MGIRPHWRSVAELGPGDSIGVGLAALLTGSDRYVALDLVPFARSERNAEILEELIGLLHDRADIPGADEFPALDPPIEDHGFPGHILTNTRLATTLAPARLDQVRRAVAGDGDGTIEIRYHAPWTDEAAVPPASVDFLFSQAVLEHLDDPAATHAATLRWLAPGGSISHVVDYSSHGLARPWNGHWTYGDALWRLIRGRRSFSLNRLAHGDHLALARDAGLEVIREQRFLEGTALARSALARPFRRLSDEDLATRGGTLQLRRSSADTPRS